MSSPVTVSVDVPQSRADVYAYLDVMANHEAFTDHILTEWRVSGPATGVGAKADVVTKSGGMSDPATIEVIEVEDGRMIRERNWGAKGKRVATGTYVLSDLPDGGTHIEFTFAFEQVPAREKPLVPLMRRMIRKGNERSMERLAEQLAGVHAAA
ncbi:SRPBCC family protein [Solirubrobacter phytolaccae]|uniref:SRPBCC family protein n=1 Tax=Solirubrobacter phytolaccae TaxID=1404360 RepID=A0A9X3N7S4_9ACTN|nr:SRPBCC family protein [Solirubrobacter phytolaccae]MDA0179261.1 SRPBCC family protein [Solirubrobacter phytolaccae]